MLIKLFGILDVFAAIVLIFLKFGLGSNVAWFFVIYIGLKALIFIKNFVSIVDLIGVIFYILAIYGSFTKITWIFVIWYLQKGLLSLLS